MKSTFIQAAIVSALAASAAEAATTVPGPVPPTSTTISEGEGAGGSRGVRVAGPLPSSLLLNPTVERSPLVTVGEGGEGRRGRHFRKFRHHYYGPPRSYYGDRRYDDRRYDAYPPLHHDPYYEPRRRYRPY